MADPVTDRLMASPLWDDRMLSSAGIAVHDAPIVSVGSGLGSFALVDTLRIAGVDASSIRVIGPLARPYDRYRHLATNSQIPDLERIRSDSGSVMDCIWGWPGYAVREAIADRSPVPLWSVATEPVLADYYTPRARQVYASVDRESARIGWDGMRVDGTVRVVRRRVGGGYHVLYRPNDAAGRPGAERVAFRCRWLHLALGYPGVQFLEDLQEYRQRHRDFEHVVNAYEPHEHVYSSLRRRQATVLVRGSGIVASRVLQRLLDDREQRGAQTTVVHLFRTYIEGPRGPVTFRRRGGHGWAYQGFNFPKSAWGGQLKDRLERAAPAERPDIVRSYGGTNTAPRRSWRRQLDRGRRGGWYHEAVGLVQEVRPGPHGGIVTVVQGPDGRQAELVADYIIDATGLDGNVRDNRVLADLLDHGGATLNPMRRLDVTTDFEVVGARNEPGRLYATGSMTLGGPYAPVDSFLGMQYASLRIADDLARQGFGHQLGAVRSVGQWWRWARGVAP